MGNFINSFSQRNSLRQEFRGLLSRISLSKLWEYYAAFKSISETYLIDNEQFSELLGATELNLQELFECLDTDHNLLIDGLELFCALTLLSSNVPFHHKIQFLFQLFDFNHMRSLSRTDIEFLILSCCTAISKLFSAPLEDNFIQQFVHEQFSKDSRVNISQMMKWAFKSKSVSLFFKLISQASQTNIHSLLSCKIHLNLPIHNLLHPLVLHSLNHEQQKFIARAYNLFKNGENQQGQSQFHGRQVLGHPHWIYGIRFKDVKQFMEIVGNEIIYFVGKVVILYNIASHKQRFYKGHAFEVISLATHGSLGASGEYAKLPSINVWSIQSLETLHILTGHTNGVHLLLFLPGLLISAGCHQESPLIIHSVQSGLAIFSSYCDGTAVDISTIHNFTSQPSDEFAIATTKVIDLYYLQRKGEGIVVNSTRLFENGRNASRITCICFFMINYNFQSLGDYDGRVQKYLLSGYQNGQICVWNVSNAQKVLTFNEEGSEIVRILASENKIWIASNSSFLRAYSMAIDEPQVLDTIDITQVDQRMSSYDIFDIRATSLGFLVVTDAGQIIFLNHSNKKSECSLSNLTHYRFPAIKVNDIINIQGVKCQKIITKQQQECLYLTQGIAIKGIDMKKHTFVREWHIGRQILSFDAIINRNGVLLIVAAVSGQPNESVLCSFAELSENVPRQTVTGQVQSIVLVHDEGLNHVSVLVSVSNAIYKYNYARGIFSKAAYLPVPSIYPRLTILQPSCLMISAAHNPLQRLSFNRQHQQMHIQIPTPGSLETNMPLKVYFYRGTDDQEPVYPVVLGRNSKALFASRCDGSIDIWSDYEHLISQHPIRLQTHTSPATDICLSEDQRLLISAGRKDKMVTIWRIQYRSEVKSALCVPQIHELSYSRPDDILVLRKLSFCMFSNDLLSDLCDQNLQLYGLKHESLRRLFKTTLHDWKNSHRGSDLSLRLDFVFGVQTFHKNNTIISLENPKRILYFTGKLIVIYNPSLNSQAFYRGHKFKVTCVALLPDNDSAASGQSAYKPVINIWKISSLQTIRVIYTGHVLGILDLTVKGSFLLSLGFKSKRQDEEQGITYLYSFELTELQSGRRVATALEQQYVYCFEIDPTNSLRFAACTENKVSFWEIVANSFQKTSVCILAQETPTACLFYNGGGTVSKPDLLVGTKSGGIGIVTRSKYWHPFHKEQKPSGQINCLLVVEIAEETLITASSEDSLLRVWNSNFQQKLCLSLSKDQIQQNKKGEHQSTENSRSVQSLCLLSRTNLKLLAGTRNGQILELQLFKQGLKGREVQEKTIVRFSAGDGVRGKGKTLLAYRPKYDVMATLGQDQVVMFWDCDRKKLLYMSQLGLDREKTRPTALRFSHNGDFLIIGFSDGLLVFLDSKMVLMEGKEGRGDEKYSQPSLKTVAKQRCEEGWAVVAIQISDGSQFMAVSYHRLTAKKSEAEVKIYINKVISRANHRPINKLESEKVYQLHSTVDNPHLQQPNSRGFDQPCGFAVAQMAFTQYEGSHYLLMIFHLLDNTQNRVWTSEREEDLKYKIRHVNNKTDSANSSSVNELIRWKKPHLFTALSANYLIQPGGYTGLPSSNHFAVPQFTTADILDGHLVLGSENGDLHMMSIAAVDNGGFASTVPAHCCKITQIEHRHDRSVIYTSGQQDHTVLRWVVDSTPNAMHLQSFDHVSDLFNQIPNPQYLSSRQASYQQNFSRPHFSCPSRGLKLHDVIGRRAGGLRNNVKVDQRGRIVYHSGQAIVISDTYNKQKEFLFDNSRSLEEVSTIQISEDGDTLVAAYSGVKTAIIVWSISTKLLLSQIYLDGILQIIYMALSHKNSRLLLFALRGKKAQGCLLMIDLHSRQIIATATYLFKPNWYVKALAFVPGSHDRFLTCGVQPLQVWHLQGGQLISTPRPFADHNRIHTCLAFGGDLLITGTDEGQLVVWKQKPFVLAVHQHMVTCLAVSKEHQSTYYIASGSQGSLEGNINQIVIFTLSNGQLRESYRVSARRDLLYTSNLLGGRISPRFQSELEIQSLCFWQEKLIIGVIKGDIFSHDVKVDLKKIQPVQASLLVAFQDGENTKALIFADEHKQLVDISEEGLLRVWRFPEIELVWSHHFQSALVDMVYSSVYDLLLLGFRGQLRFLCWNEQKRSLQEIEERAIQFNFLTHLVLSHNDQFLALGIQSNSDRSHLIEVYELGQKEFRLKLKMRFDSVIEFIDFNRTSGEKIFILIKTLNRLELYDLNSLSEAPLQLACKLEWVGLGLQVAQKTKKARDAHQEISGSLPIKSIVEVAAGVIIVDTSGDLYVFRDAELVCRSSLGVGGGESVGVSRSGRWVGIASRWDRNIVIWEVSLQK